MFQTQCIMSPGAAMGIEMETAAGYQQVEFINWTTEVMTLVRITWVTFQQHSCTYPLSCWVPGQATPHHSQASLMGVVWDGTTQISETLSQCDGTTQTSETVRPRPVRHCHSETVRPRPVRHCHSQRTLFCDRLHSTLVVSLTRESWALFPPVTETLWADSRAVTYCLEDGRLTCGGCVVVVKEWKPTAVSVN